eukprot:gene20127-26858_t
MPNAVFCLSFFAIAPRPRLMHAAHTMPVPPLGVYGRTGSSDPTSCDALSLPFSATIAVESTSACAVPVSSLLIHRSTMCISLLLAALLACTLTLSSGRPGPHHLGASSIRMRQLAQAPLDIRRITCPVMAALVKNGDLATNANGEVTKAAVVLAMRAVGIAEDVLQPAADGNFDHLPEPKVSAAFC